MEKIGEMRFGMVFFLLLFTAMISKAQLYVPFGNDVYHLLDRVEIKSGFPHSNYHSSVKPLAYKTILSLIFPHRTDPDYSHIDIIDINSFAGQAFFFTEYGKRNEPVLKYFYTQDAALYGIKTNDLKLSINPVLYFAGGMEQGKIAGNKFNKTLYINSRGAEIQGIVDNRYSFYTFITDNQMRVPLQSKLFGDSVYSLPGESFFKKFKGSGVDFLHAEGYVSAPVSKNISWQFGNSKQFIGDGIRSLILSDFSKPHLFLKLNTNVWKINYQNLFYELTDSAYATNAGVYKKKFGATHHISINVSNNFNIGFFETVIFKREGNAFELNYLNPIIFYRAVEHSLGSPDNVILGLNYKINIKRRMQVYGQIVFDEFVMSHLRDQLVKPRSDSDWGWWGNKFAVQLGTKFIDLFKIKNLDLQLEYNHIRPYTYAYTNPSLSFTDFNQSMVHPLGANLKELTTSVIYKPVTNLAFQLRTFNAITGTDTSSATSYGSDILKSTHSKPLFFGVATGQGLKTLISYYELTITYRIAQQLFFDAGYTYRSKKTDLIRFNHQNSYFMFGLRLNASKRDFMY